MRKVVLLLPLIVLFGCAYSSKVKRLPEEDLCKNLGKYTLYSNQEGISITQEELKRKNIDQTYCSNIANDEVVRLAPSYKLKLCQNLASYHYKGLYTHFKNTLQKIQNAGFADEECSTMADFYLIRISRKQERDQTIANALNQAAENMRRTNEQSYGRGSALNPIHIKIE